MSGASAPAHASPAPEATGLVTSTTTSAVTRASVAATMSARRTRAGIAAQGTRTRPAYEALGRRVAILCKAMSLSGAEFVKQIRGRVAEVDPAQVRELSGEGVVVVDVREQEEWDQGHLPGAIHIPRGYLESRIDGVAPD